MSQISTEEMKKRGEMLKRARQILVQEYTAMRSQQHQQWIKDSENSWRTNGVLIAYPPAKMYPTEQEVVNKALELYNRSHQPVITVETTPSTQPELQPTSTTSAFDVEPISITEQLQAAYNAPTETSIIDTGGVTEMPPTLPTITKVVQAGGDFVIIHEPINLDSSVLVVEPEVKEEPKVEEPKEEVKEEPVEETKTEEPVAKHSLLRSVLSGWLSKNKDKDKL